MVWGKNLGICSYDLRSYKAWPKEWIARHQTQTTAIWYASKARTACKKQQLPRSKEYGGWSLRNTGANKLSAHPHWAVFCVWSEPSGVVQVAPIKPTQFCRETNSAAHQSVHRTLQRGGLGVTKHRRVRLCYPALLPKSTPNCLNRQA